MALFRIENKEKFNLFSKDFWMSMVVMTIIIWLVADTTSLAYVKNPLYALLAAVIISFLNAFVRPVLSFFSLPFIWATLGLFILVINAIIILLTSLLLGDNFIVSGFGNAFWFSIIVTILNFLLNIPRRIKKVTDDVFGRREESNKKPNNTNNTTEDRNSNANNSGNNLFDDNPFNDNPKEKNYTDFEEVDDKK